MTRLAIFAVLVALGGCGSLRPEASSVGVENETAAAPASASAERRGFDYAEANCAGCHAVGVMGESPLPAAPRFRDLGLRYPVDDLAEAFAEGIDTGHPSMPEFVMSTEENSDLIAYLKSIQGQSTH